MIKFTILAIAIVVLFVYGTMSLLSALDKQALDKAATRADAHAAELNAQNQALTTNLVDQNRTLTAAELKNADRFYVMAQTNQMLVALLGVGLFIAAVIVPVSFVFMLIYFRRSVPPQVMFSNAPAPVSELPYAHTVIMRDPHGNAIAVVSPAKDVPAYRG